MHVFHSCIVFWSVIPLLYNRLILYEILKFSTVFYPSSVYLIGRYQDLTLYLDMVLLFEMFAKQES